MNTQKSKSIRTIEEKMQRIEPGSMRHQVLEAARNFKSSWIALGQILYSVYKDKMYKEWEYLTFEAYCKKEVGIHKQTASKLLHSYYFLEKSEPEFLKSVTGQEAQGSFPQIPSVDAVNVLRLAVQKREFSEEDYQEIKKSVFEDGLEGKEVQKQVGLRLRSIREEEDPLQAQAQRRLKTLRRYLGMIGAFQKEAVYGKLVGERTAKEIDILMQCLKKEIGDSGEE